MLYARLFLIGLMPLFANAVQADEPRVIPLTEAAKHVDQNCTIEFTVNSSRLLADKNICFLNSERDHRDEKNFTAVVMKDGLEKFRTAGIADPATHFQGKKIRVTGKVALHEQKPQIVVNEASQITLVKEKPATK